MRLRISAVFEFLAVGTCLLISIFALQAKPSPAEGGELFEQQCAMCHGTDGKGFPAMKTPDFTDPKVQASLTNREIFEAIKNGR